MRACSDNEIEFWSEVFTACRLASEGLSFVDFMNAPWATLNQLGMSDAMDVMASGFLPLLPSQARIRKTLDGEGPMCESMNGQVAPPSPLRVRSALGAQPLSHHGLPPVAV